MACNTAISKYSTSENCVCYQMAWLLDGKRAPLPVSLPSEETILFLKLNNCTSQYFCGVRNVGTIPRVHNLFIYFLSSSGGDAYPFVGGGVVVVFFFFFFWVGSIYGESVLWTFY